MGSKELQLYKIRHSLAHIMAQAVTEMFPTKTKIAIGPPVEDGFYYDFDLPRSLAPDDLEAIERRMKEIVKEGHSFFSKEVTAEEARKIFSDQPYKLELIDEIEQGNLDENGKFEGKSEKPVISTYQHSDFVDLCRGPHVKDTIEINPESFRLLSVAGAYWRGDSDNKMLQRIYATAWETPKELEEHLQRLEEAKKRDHRKLGKELGLFILSPEVGPGLPLWLPKGASVRRVIEDFVLQEELKNNYQIVYTPHLGKKSLWVRSGHWALYQDKMYAPSDTEGIEYLAKPMNCPMHMMIYKSRMRSYKELPVKLAETATVYRREQAGELIGLLRVRSITQDDAHIFVRSDQLKDEFISVLDQAIYRLQIFGFKDFEMWLSVRDPRNKDKYLGSDETWEGAEGAVAESLKKRGWEFTRAEGEAKFYGPALDVMIKDCLGRKWQCSTIQVDFMLPERFGLEYIDKDGKRKRPIVLHRALLGSMERFVAILIEHYAGKFPVWLAPVQAIIIPISDRHQDYSWKVSQDLKSNGLRIEVDDRAETLQAKVRDAQLQKIPYMVIVGDREIKSESVSVRLRSGEDLKSMPIDQFSQRILTDVAKREID